MSKYSTKVKVAGLEFLVTGSVDLNDRPPCEDMEARVIFDDENESVLVEVPDEMLDGLAVWTVNFWQLLRDYLTHQLVLYAQANP